MSSGSSEGMFRRLTRLVTAPARELVGMAPAKGDTDIKPTEFDKAEMKAMIERKRRNDYVRKRELDMLRRIRREGLSADQAAALTMQSSRMDDSEVRSTQSSVHSVGIKAKIDAIERQMVGATAGVSAGSGTSAAGAAAAPQVVAAPRPGSRNGPALPPGPPPPILTTTIFDDDDNGTPTVPVADPADDLPAPVPSAPAKPRPRADAPLLLNIAEPGRAPAAGARPAAPAVFAPTQVEAAGFMPTAPFTQPATGFAPTEPFDARGAAAARAPVASPPPPPPGPPLGAIDLGNREWVEVSEIVHDATLDEPVIAFAGGDFQGCEAALLALVGSRGERRDHDETWLVLFDLYRAIGQQAKFESLTNDYVERFHRSGPQWLSLPRLLAEATSSPQADERLRSQAGGIGWVCPPVLDLDAVARFDALSMQLPLPWVMDWSGLDTIHTDAAARLRHLMTQWAPQALTMRWVGGERLMQVLRELAPTGVRDADPVYWMLHLEALRLTHRPDQFDDVAIDYCVTYEVSPPSWERARCNAHLVGVTMNTRTLSLSVMGDAVTTFQDSTIGEAPAMPVQVSSVELAGQLAGDLGEMLGRLSAQVGEARVIRISCALLMRVDFVAAGDLLNWVNARHAEGREVVFTDTHRLVALMFGAMGITDNARVQLRQA